MEVRNVTEVILTKKEYEVMMGCLRIMNFNPAGNEAKAIIVMSNPRGDMQIIPFAELEDMEARGICIAEWKHLNINGDPARIFDSIDEALEVARRIVTCAWDDNAGCARAMTF